MKTETKYGVWSIIKEDSDKSITALTTVVGSGVQQIISFGDANSLISLFAKYPIRIKKIELSFATDAPDNKAIEIDKVPLVTTTLKSILLKVASTTDQSHILNASSGNTDVFSMPFRLDFIITYVLNQNYDITVMLEEQGA